MIKLGPQSRREAALTLGAPEWKTSLRVILPAAANGVLTGILLGLARAAGETAPLLFTALGNDRFEMGQIVSSGIANGEDVFSIIGRIFSQPVDSLPLTFWKYAQQLFPERIEQSWAVAFILMVLILVMNILARGWMQKSSNRLKK